MAKKSMIEKNKTRIRLSNLDLAKRKALKVVIMNKQTPIDERFQAQLKLAKMRRNGADVNASGGSYIYMAFAAEPLVANVGSGIPATAR